MTKAFNTIYYSKISGDLTELLDLREMMALKVIDDDKIKQRVEKEDDAAFLQKLVTNEILAERKKINLVRTNEMDMGIKKYNFFTEATIAQSALALNISLPCNLISNYYFKGYRTTRITIPNMHIAPKTVFEVKKLTNAYPTEKFSIGITMIENGQLIGFALSVIPATTGMKGQAQCLLSCLTHDEYIVDDGAKYFDVSQLIANMSV